VFTKCPYCQTLFQINEEQLLAANGKAHCCRCDRIFNARENLREQAPHDPASHAAAQEDSPPIPSPSNDTQWSDQESADKALSEIETTQDDQERIGQDLYQSPESILEARSFEPLSYGDRFPGLSEDDAIGTDEQHPLEPIPILDLEPLPLDLDQGQYSLPGDEPMPGDVPDLDDIDQLGLDDNLPGILLDQEGPEPIAQSSSDPQFGAEFMLSQIAQAEPSPPAPAPLESTEEAAPATEETTLIDASETPLEAGQLLQESMPGQQDTEAEQEAQLQKAEQAEPVVDPVEDLPAIEPGSDETPYPEEILPAAAPSRRGGAFWALAVVVLLLLALGQTAWLFREGLLGHPPSRQFLASVCQILDCRLPEQRAPDKLEIMNRSVASHPQTPNALQILLTLSNQADFPQPYPQIQLSLFNTKEELLARRRFQPGEYLNRSASGHPLLQPRQPVQLEIVLQDPGEDATGFKFDFF
jgi:predicted Zn finger-like uncharacterized protein